MSERLTPSQVQDTAHALIELLQQEVIDTDSQVFQSVQVVPVRDLVLFHFIELFDSQEVEAHEKLARLLTGLTIAVASLESDTPVRAMTATVLAGGEWILDRRFETESALLVAMDSAHTPNLAELLNTAVTHNVPNRIWLDSLRDISAQQILDTLAVSNA